MNPRTLSSIPLMIFSLCWTTLSVAQENSLNLENIVVSEVGPGWAKNSVNTTIFRKNSITSYKKFQYVAYYDSAMNIVIGKKKWGAKEWELTETGYKGDATDAHRSISIMADGNGYIHMVWGQHNDPLRYAKSLGSGTLKFAQWQNMTGQNEERISYPEFFRLPSGDLLFFYRNGESGNGNLAIKRYVLDNRKWEDVHLSLIDGEKNRNAYWQAVVDKNGIIHLSWVWRETWDVSTNHDMCYARSFDGGRTWENALGVKYELPITIENSKVAWKIPPESELINQTSMCTDGYDNPVIASYWCPEGSDIPQYHIIYLRDGNWSLQQVSDRQTSFSLKGGGTKSIPISRPQVLSKWNRSKEMLLLIGRDAERGNRPTVFVNQDFPAGKWEAYDLSDEDLGAWEPSLDKELWEKSGQLSLFLQKTIQVDGEGLDDEKPHPVKVLEWKP